MKSAYTVYGTSTESEYRDSTNLTYLDWVKLIRVETAMNGKQ